MKILPGLLTASLCGMMLCTMNAAVPAPESKEQRDARMAWWREARFGMFIHWGVYAVPGGIWEGKDIGGGGEWVMHEAKIAVADYKKLPAQFNPVKFDADAWVAVAKAAGMKYIVITAKHHDGFAMFASKASPFNIVDATPFKRDPLKELAAACRKQGIKLGFYYSQDQDWTAPGGASFGGHWDKAQDGDFASYLHTKAIPQLKELLTNYQDAPAVIWFDTPTADMTPALSQEIVALLKEHPGLIWNNRLGGGDPGDTETPEQHIPPTGYPGRDWETCMTINDTWGFKTHDLKWKSTETLLRNLIDIASKGGNYLLNVGPDAEGLIPPPEVERLEAVGQWLKINGEAIYGTQAGPFRRGLPWGRATQKPGQLFLHVFDWPKDGRLLVPIGSPIESAALLAEPSKNLAMKKTEAGLEIAVPNEAPDAIATVIVLTHKVPIETVAQIGNPEALTAGEAEVKGSTATQEEHDGVVNIGYWTNPKDAIEWQARFPDAGRYAVSMTYACDANSGGSKFTVSVDGSSLAGVVAETGSWGTYRTVPLGEITVAHPGVATVRLAPSEKPGMAVMNFRELSLIPVKK